MQVFESLSDEVRLAYAHRRDELPRVLLCSTDAAERLAEHLEQDAKGKRACVLFDQRTRRAAGSLCVDALESRAWLVSNLLIEDPTDGATPVCDDVTRDQLFERLPSCDVLVAVGSGVVNDLTKWLAADAGLPYAAFATASSMNGYSSANVAPKIRGVKSFAKGRAARVVAADLNVLRAAPYHLTASGFGDLLAKPVSTADWVMNHELFGEAFAPTLASLVDRFDKMVFDNPRAIARGEADSLRSLFEALALSGCTMTLHGSSLPASGGEHVISHTLDMMSDADGVKHDLHGRQVGVGTVLSAALWDRMMRMDNPSFQPWSSPFDRTVWGAAADTVALQREAKIAATHQACVILSRPDAWDALRARVSPYLLPPSLLRDRLQAANAAWKLEHIGCSRGRFVTALRNAGAMRGRLTSVDLAHIVGLLPGQAETLVDEFVI